DRCGAAFADGVEACPVCGTVATAPLGAQQRTSPKADSQDDQVEEHLIGSAGERKLLTLLFCDIVGSTSLAEQIGPDAMYRLVERFFELSAAEVHRYDGMISQFLGDGFLAVFGSPIAY